MELSLTQELDKRRAAHQAPDTSEGMAVVWHKRENGNWAWCGFFTVVFAKAWCADDPAYRWERL